MTNKILYLTRHAQAYHNVAEDYSIPDAELTPLGREQSAALRRDTEGTFQKEADLIVSSPLRRPMQTALIGYAPLIERLTKEENKPMILLPELQEVNDLPCDTGSSLASLSSNPEFSSLSFSSLSPSPLPAHWLGAPSWTSKQGIFDPARVGERVKWVRKWLKKREEERIVVVAHGDVLRWLTATGDPKEAQKPWANAEVRAFRFANNGDDDEAYLVPATDISLTAGTPSSEKKQGGEEEETVVKEGEEEPTSSELKN
ncbi:hypothetical protein JCM10908_006629 [Rhodotorula pacifica]|uniref:histidine phosphatase family protein n=1 Tax=Rhodotorula pacifica TaxID=1495444 RepID=UPI00317204C7